MNRILLIGNLGQNAEIRAIDNMRSKGSFSLATNKTYKNREGQTITNTSWHDIISWEKELIDIIEKYGMKGKQFVVEGESVKRSYQDRNGNTRYVNEIKASKLMPIEMMINDADAPDSLHRASITGRLMSKPVLSSDEQGQSICTLVFATKHGQLPIQLTGPKAEIATRYLDEGRAAHITYEIVSTDPFHAIGLDLTLLGQRPDSEAGTYQKQERNQTPAGNAITEEEAQEDLSALPF